MGSGVTQGVLHDPRPHAIVAFLRELPVNAGNASCIPVAAITGV
jgi:hypothetical protein